MELQALKRPGSGMHRFGMSNFIILNIRNTWFRIKEFSIEKC